MCLLNVVGGMAREVVFITDEVQRSDQVELAMRGITFVRKSTCKFENLVV